MQLNKSLKRTESIENVQKLDLLFKNVAPGSYEWGNSNNYNTCSGGVDLIGTPIREVNSENYGLVDLHSSSDDATHKIGNKLVCCIAIFALFNMQSSVTISIQDQLSRNVAKRSLTQSNNAIKRKRQKKLLLMQQLQILLQF